MKVLIISYSFPPRATGAATVMYNICRYLPKRCYNVITTKSEPFFHLGSYDKEYMLDCNTIRLLVRTERTFDCLKFSLLTVFKGLVLNKKEGIDCIFAVYPNYSNLLGAYALHKITGKPLVIYMHDLFSEVKKSDRTHKIWEFLERKIFSSASRILVMNEKFKNYYLKRGVSNLTIFPPSIDLDHYSHSTISTKMQLRALALKIAFTGSVYIAHESAVLAFLKAAENVSDIEVLFATPSKKDYLKEVSVGFLSKRKCIELQRSADVLFLPISLDAPYPEEVKCAIPCKVLEYLAAGKPILAVVPKGSFMEDFIKKHDVGIAVTELSAEKIVEAIEELKNENKRKEFSRNALKTVKLFDSRVRSQQLSSILNDVVSSCA